MSTRSYAHASGRHPKATRCSSRRWWRSFGRRRTERLLSRLRSRRCSPRASTSSNRMSGRCSSADRSKAGSSTGGRCRPWPEEPQVMARLTALVRKELVRPDKPQLPGEDAFRFRHLLIRDAAYDALPKSTRAELHERFALCLGEHGSDLVELDEILGYHIEQACRYRQELGLGGDEPLAAAARRRLGAAGNRAHQRGDHAAALLLLERAAALVPRSELDLAIEHDLIGALLWRGEGSEALRRIRSLADRVSAGGNGLGELFARIKECEYRLQFDPEGATDDLAALLDVALPRFEAEGDDFFLTIAYKALGLVARERGQMGAALDAFDRAAAHAQRA